MITTKSFSLDEEVHLPLLEAIAKDLISKKRLRWNNQSRVIQILIESYRLPKESIDSDLSTVTVEQTV